MLDERWLWRGLLLLLLWFLNHGCLGLRLRLWSGRCRSLLLLLDRR